MGGGETARGVVMMHGLTEAAHLGALYEARRSSFWPWRHWRYVAT